MKMLASLSLDLDNQWSYMKTHGDVGWESFPSYLDVVVPRVLKFLKDRDLTITFFIVGQDAVLEKNRDAIASIAAAGHEIGNHSFSHEPWLNLYSKDEIIREIAETESALCEITGRWPLGFRGPGYSLSQTVLDVLAERDYEYDCSMLPTFVGPLARTFYFLKSPKMSDEEREKRKQLFGSFSDGLQTIRPHLVEAGSKQLVEIPVSTFPVIKTPIHASYLIYLSQFSKVAAMTYWRSALAMCRMSGIEPSILLHPLDFLGGEDIDELKFFPGMNIAAEKKMDIVSHILGTLSGRFEIVNMRTHARSAREKLQMSEVIRTKGFETSA